MLSVSKYMNFINEQMLKGNLVLSDASEIKAMRQAHDCSGRNDVFLARKLRTYLIENTPLETELLAFEMQQSSKPRTF